MLYLSQASPRLDLDSDSDQGGSCYQEGRINVAKRSAHEGKGVRKRLISRTTREKYLVANGGVLGS
jgi:hypothetical protein